MSKKRTSYYCPEAAAGHVAAILARTLFETPAAAVRAALSAYSDLLEVTLSGYKIWVRDGSGREWLYMPYAPLNCPEYAAQHGGIDPAAIRKVPKNIVFPEEITARIALIHQRTHLQSHADVIRAALLSYDDLTRVVTEGGDVIIRGRDGIDRPYTPFAPLIRDGLVLLGQPTPSPRRRASQGVHRTRRPEVAPV